MGLLRWFHKDEASKPAAPSPIAKTPAAHKPLMVELDFARQLAAYSRWRQQLENFIDGLDQGSIHPETIGRDDACQLGNWLYGHGQTHFGYLETFADLREQHAALHRYAHDVVTASQDGRQDEARQILEQAECQKTNERVKLALSRLFILLKDGNAPGMAHQRWFARLKDYVDGRSQETWDPQHACKDDLCPLGRWLQGSGKDYYGEHRAFSIVRDSHTRLHVGAAEIVRAVLDGKRLQARALLDHGDFAKTNAQLNFALKLLFRPPVIVGARQSVTA